LLTREGHALMRSSLVIVHSATDVQAARQVGQLYVTHDPKRGAFMPSCEAYGLCDDTSRGAACGEQACSHNGKGPSPPLSIELGLVGHSSGREMTGRLGNEHLGNEHLGNTHRGNTHRGNTHRGNEHLGNAGMGVVIASCRPSSALSCSVSSVGAGAGAAAGSSCIRLADTFHDEFDAVTQPGGPLARFNLNRNLGDIEEESQRRAPPPDDLPHPSFLAPMDE